MDDDDYGEFDPRRFHNSASEPDIDNDDEFDLGMFYSGTSQPGIDDDDDCDLTMFHGDTLKPDINYNDEFGPRIFIVIFQNLILMMLRNSMVSLAKVMKKSVIIVITQLNTEGFHTVFVIKFTRRQKNPHGLP